MKNLLNMARTTRGCTAPGCCNGPEPDEPEVDEVDTATCDGAQPEADPDKAGAETAEIT